MKWLLLAFQFYLQISGSAYDLVEDGYNGFKFNPYSIESIQESLIKFIDLSIDEKIQFSFNSNKLAKELNHENWNNTLISLFKLI